MFILQIFLILFLVVVTILLIALIIVRRITWKLNRTIKKTFSSDSKTYNDNKNSINELYRRKKINSNEGEYVDFEEIKP